jgi:hypothetical protein
VQSGCDWNQSGPFSVYFPDWNQSELWLKSIKGDFNQACLLSITFSIEMTKAKAQGPVKLVFVLIPCALRDNKEPLLHFQTAKSHLITGAL